MTDPSSLDWAFQTGSVDIETDDKRFQNKTILITGAGGQLGRAGCVYFGQRGAKIIALDVQAELLMETYRATKYCAFKPYLCDVTDASKVDAVVHHAVEMFGRIDLVWNNAGYQGQIAPILEQDPKDFQTVMNINVSGMFHVLQSVGKHMKSHGGSIVNTASVAGLRGTPAMIGYAASKAAVISMSIVSAKEWAQYNIRVNALSPALIGPGKLWDRQNDLHSQVGAPFFADTPQAVATNKVNSVPMKRLGTSQEVVRSVAFLLSDDAAYTTGINLTVDGGMAAGIKA